MLTSLYFFGKKEIRTWGKDVLFDSLHDPTDIVVAIEDFSNINKDNAVTAYDGFVDEENKDWDLFLTKVSNACDISWKICLKWGWWRNEFLTSGFSIAALYPDCYRLIMWGINTHGMWVNG